MTKVNTDEWLRQFDKTSFQILESNFELIDKAADILFENIKKRTPIGRPELWHYPAPKGYTPGTLRASWDINGSINKTGGTIIISNDQPYAERVEYGWSTQAPEGMLRISLLEWQSIINKLKR